MAYIISSIITIIFSILFLIWGIYQIKTGKMVAKNAKNPIDEPREVGILFITLALMGFGLGLNLLIRDNLTYTIMMFVTLIAFSVYFIFSIIGFADHRIITIKSSPKLNKLVKKFYIPANIALLIFSLTSPLAILFICVNIFAPISLISFLIFVIYMIIINHKHKSNKK